jgi:hypothetical protein
MRHMLVIWNILLTNFWKILNDKIIFYKINYDYSSYFVKPILNSFGFTNGISIILQHSPPTDEELLNPELYYKRIKTF